MIKYAYEILFFSLVLLNTFDFIMYQRIENKKLTRIDYIMYKIKYPNKKRFYRQSYLGLIIYNLPKNYYLFSVWCCTSSFKIYTNKKNKKIFFFVNNLCIILTLIVIFGGDSKNGMLNIFIFINFSLVECLIKIWWIVVFISNTNTNEFCHC